MKELMLSKLPPPVTGKRGWPWTEESKALPAVMQDGKPWPKISIVTPSYNQAQFLEETIRSILLQNYPNVEYIIMDGGSMDNSVEIIKKYEPWLTYWVSEKDNGQADAIYRGFEIATGQLLAWINSDDYYLANAFSAVAKMFENKPAMEMVVGTCLLLRSNGSVARKNYGLRQDFENFVNVGMFGSQPAFFFRHLAYNACGKIDRNLEFCMDYDLITRMSKERTPVVSSKVLAVYREHDATKSARMQETLLAEDALIGARYGRAVLGSEPLSKIRKQAWREYYRRQRIQFYLDIIRDPLYFFSTGLRKILRLKTAA